MDFQDPFQQEQPVPPAPQPPAPTVSNGRENPVFSIFDVVVIVVAAVAALVASFAITAIVFAVVHSPAKVDPKELATNAVFLVPAQVAAYILTIGFMVLYVWLRYRINFLDAIRWNMPRSKVIAGGLLGGGALALTSGLLEGLLQRWMPKSTPFQEFFGTPASAYALVAFGVLVAPLVEEIFFRGFLYPALARPMGAGFAMVLTPALARPTGAGLAVVITSALFALLHSSQLANAWAPVLILFVVGSALTIVRAVTRSVATCVIVHMAYNLTLFTITFFQTEGFHHMERAS